MGRIYEKSLLYRKEVLATLAVNQSPVTFPNTPNKSWLCASQRARLALRVMIKRQNPICQAAKLGMVEMETGSNDSRLCAHLRSLGMVAERVYIAIIHWPVGPLTATPPRSESILWANRRRTQGNGSMDSKEGCRSLGR